jgi:hypothetical protein
MHRYHILTITSCPTASASMALHGTRKSPGPPQLEVHARIQDKSASGPKVLDTPIPFSPSDYLATSGYLARGAQRIESLTVLAEDNPYRKHLEHFTRCIVRMQAYHSNS